MPRKTHKIKSKKTILLIVEGYTEKIYFSQMKFVENNQNVTIIPRMAKHSSLVTILETAIKEAKEKIYDSIWCVFDRDVLLSTGSSKELELKFNEANRLNIQFADSLPAFEIWFLLHYVLPKQYYKNQDELINEFGLDRKMRMNKLSKGMQSMVTIIVALASGARFTFLDEPVTGLDVVAREYFYKVLLDEYAKGERTFVISTHIIEEAANVFEEVIFIHEGKALLKEETDSLLERTIHISGKEEDVDAVCDGKKVHHVEKLGRSKGVTVLLNPGEEPDTKGRDVDIRPLSLQDVFVALCGKEESYE